MLLDKWVQADVLAKNRDIFNEQCLVSILFVDIYYIGSYYIHALLFHGRIYLLYLLCISKIRHISQLLLHTEI